PINSFFREARQLGTGMPLLESWQEDESLRTGQTLIMGIPTSSSKTRSSLINDDANDFWHQRFYSVWADEYPDETSEGFIDWNKATYCTTSTCNNRIPIRSVYPVELTYNAHDEKTYGLWVTHSRTDFDDAYKIHIAEYTGNGENLQFGENLLKSSRVQFQTTTKPTLHCGGIAAS